MEYTINTDAASMTFDADDADAAARRFASTQGYDGIDNMDDLVSFVEDQDGYITVLEDDAILHKTATMY